MKRSRTPSLQFKTTAASFLALVACALPLHATTYNWVPTTAGPFAWDDMTTPVNNWGTAGTFPNNTADVANVTSNLTANQVINLNEQITLGVLNVGDTDASNTFTIAPNGGSFLFDNGAANGQINQTATSKGDTISAPISIGGNGTLGVSNASATNALTLSGAVGSGVGDGNTHTFAVSGAGTVVVSGAISDGSLGDVVAVTKAGTGALTLSGANTFTGGITLGTGGTLNINSATALGGAASAFTINGGTLNDSASGDITIANNNAQAWNGDFTFTGTHNLNLGTGAVTLGGNRIITVNANTLTVGGVINDNNVGGTSQGYSLTKAGAGGLTLSKANTYSGATVILGGTVSIGSATSFGTATSDILLGNTSGSVNTTLNVGSLSRNLTLQSGNTGTVTLTPNSGFSGTITLGSANGIGHSVTLNTNNSGSNTFSGKIVDPAGLQAGTAGVVTLNESYNLPNFGNGSSTYSGGTIINNANFNNNNSFLGLAGGSIFGTGNVTINSVTIRENGSSSFTITGTNTQTWNGNFSTIDNGSGSSLNLALSGAINLGSVATNQGFGTGNTARTLLVNQPLTVAGALTSGSNGVTTGFNKAGGSTLVLSGASTYTGATGVAGGILQITGGNDRLPTTTILNVGAGTGTLAVLSSNAFTTTGSAATFDLNGLNQTVAGVGDFTAGATNGTITNANTTTASILTVNTAVASTYDGTMTNGTKTLSLVKSGASSLTLNLPSTFSGTTTVSNGTLTLNGSGAAASTASLTTTNASANVTTTSTSGFVVGQRVSGTGIQGGSYITAITSGTTFTVSANATASATVTGTFARTGGLGVGGAVTVNNGGTLQANAVGALAQNSIVTVNTGGILQLSATNSLGAGAAAAAGGSTTSLAGTLPLTLGGGTLLRAAAVSQGNGAASNVGIGLLTLSTGTTSTLDFSATGSGTLSFSAFAPGSGSFLNVLNDNNNTGAAGVDGMNDRLVFNQDLVTAGTIGNIEFNGVAATMANEINLGGGEFEILPNPVPEPSTWVGIALALVAGGTLLRYRRSKN